MSKDKKVLIETPEELRARALALYTAPFRFKYGYIYDSQNKVVADNSSGRDEVVTSHVDGNLLLRIRGWGRIQKFHDPEQLQDCVGELMCEALNAYWEKQNGHVIELVIKSSIQTLNCEYKDFTLMTTSTELKQLVTNINDDLFVAGEILLKFACGENIYVARDQIITILMNLDCKKIII